MFDLAGVLLDFGGVESVAGPYPGALELVDRLRRHAKVACLSNTNVLDVRRFRYELNLPPRFDACFFSNEIGYRKPNADSYLHVLGAFGLTASPGRALFLDDSTACVEGARQVGMQACRVCGIREISACLAALGIPSSDASPFRRLTPRWSRPRATVES